MLYPPEGQEPKCLVHFVGGAFVGAAPQLAYRPLLEALAARGALVSGQGQGHCCSLAWLFCSVAFCGVAFCGVALRKGSCFVVYFYPISGFNWDSRKGE